MTPSAPPVIDRLGHLAIRVRDLDAAVREAIEVMGMREVRRDGDGVHLRLGDEHHALQYIAAEEDALDHLGLQAAGPAGLEEVRARVAAEGLAVVGDGVLDRHGLGDGFAFVGPDGVTYEVYVTMERGQAPYHPTGVRPTRLGHVTMHPQDPPAVCAFLQRVLGFRLSDTVGTDGFFLRCTSEHHGIALFRGRGTLHHHAWECQSLGELGRLADLLGEQRRRLLWGPIRHGVGNNIAAYFLEPAGSVVEYYADMEHIYDEATFQPRVWDADDPWWWSRWAQQRPDGFRDHGLVPVAR
jgi:catechol 2,3-dioxygenase